MPSYIALSLLGATAVCSRLNNHVEFVQRRSKALSYGWSRKEAYSTNSGTLYTQPPRC